MLIADKTKIRITGVDTAQELHQYCADVAVPRLYKAETLIPETLFPGLRLNMADFS